MIWLILIIGLILRLISLDQSLWLDEAINVLAARNSSFIQILTEYPKFDFHPPLYFSILWGWIRIFGSSEIALRIPSVVFGIGTIFLIFLIGKKLISPNLGIMSAMLLATNSLHIYYSQEARMYSFAAFAAALNFYYFLGVLSNTPPRWSLGWILVLSNLLVLLSDYLAYLIFPAQFIVILLVKRKVLKTWLISLIIAAVGYTFWVPTLFEQLNVGQVTAMNVPAWKMVVGESGIKPLILTYVKFIIGRISHPDLVAYALLFLPAGSLFAFLIWQARKSDSFTKILLFSWLLIPIILAWLISFVIPVYSFFRMLFVLPAFIILIALGISKFKAKLKYLFLSLVIVSQLVSLGIYLFNPVFQREDWRGLVSFLKSQPKNSMILFESNGSIAPFDYYAGDSIKGIGALNNFPANDFNDVADLDEKLNNASSVFLIDYLVEISDPKRLVSKKLIELGYHQIDIKNFNGVGFVYYYVMK